VRFCMQTSRKSGFDSVAYDILFDEDRLLIAEMSFAYLDSAVADCPRHREATMGWTAGARRWIPVAAGCLGGLAPVLAPRATQSGMRVKSHPHRRG
jgi:hypothetical protein